MQSIPQHAAPSRAPFDIPLWSKWLRGHPLHDYIIHGLRYGFSIGHIKGFTLTQAPFNVQWDEATDLAIVTWFQKAVEKGYMIGPFLRNSLPTILNNLHCSPFFVLPKPGRPGQWRPLHHCSFPRWGVNLNSTIHPQYRSVRYINLREIITWIQSIGPHPYLWIADATDAYFKVPVQPADWHILGIQWREYYLAFTVLPQGCTSSSLIYTRFGDAILYIVATANKEIFIEQDIVKLRHYLDDFFGGANKKSEAQLQYRAMLDWFKKLGIPTTEPKCTSPRRIIKILGWIHHTDTKMITLAEKQQIKCHDRALELYTTQHTTAKKVEKCVGSLMHATEAFWAGKAFVRRIQRHLFFQQKHGNRTLPGNTRITLSEWDKRDLKWWLDKLPTMHNGVSYNTILMKPNATDIRCYSDASSLIGLGAWTSNNRCYQTRWTQTFLQEVNKIRGVLDIQVLELLGPIVAAKLWGHHWREKSITFYIDNGGAFHAVKDKCAALHRLDLDCLVRELCSLSIDFDFKFWIVQIHGDHNQRADALSRYKPLNKSGSFTFETPEDTNFAVNNCFTQLMREPLNGRTPPNHRVEDTRKYVF